VGAVLARDRYVVGFALLSALVAWLPWSKSPGAGMLRLTGSATGLHAVVNAWDMPAKILWSTGRAVAPSGVELGWIVVGLPLLMIVGCTRGWSGGALRGLAGLQAGVALVFIAQAYRIVHDTDAAFRAAVHPGTPDLLGLGPYVLLVASVALLVAPRR
jgi:hypothetical protein